MESNSSASVDLDEGGINASGSPPSMPPQSLPIPPPGRLTPPSSPNVSQPREGWEPVELQLDYWSKPALGEKGKSTLRQAFKVLHVQRLPALGENPTNHLSMNYTTKEKKQKSLYKNIEFIDLFSSRLLVINCFFSRFSYETWQEEGKGKRKRAKKPERGWCHALDLLSENSQHSIARYNIFHHFF